MIQPLTVNDETTAGLILHDDGTYTIATRTDAWQKNTTGQWIHWRYRTEEWHPEAETRADTIADLERAGSLIKPRNRWPG